MGDFAYLSLDVLKANSGEAVTNDDATYRRVLEGVSEEIDNEMRRHFRSILETREYTAKRSDRLHLSHDLVSLTSLKTDEDEDWDYDNTWVATDYWLMPTNAPDDEDPYTKIETRTNGSFTFPAQVNGVQVVGIWAYWQRLARAASLLNEGAGLTAAATTVNVDAGTDFDVLETILIDSEQMYITAISTNALTVIRGVYGTTAAIHADDSVIDIYRYPGPIGEAVAIQAGRLFKRGEAPFGVTGSAGMGQLKVIPELDPDVKLLLRRYKRHLRGAI